MCCSKVTLENDKIMEIAYISNVEEFVQHLMALFEYLVDFPTLGNYDDEFEAHVVNFDGLDVMFFHTDT